MDGLSVYDVRWHEEYGGSKGHRFEIHEPEEIPEEGVLDQPLRPDDEALLQAGSPGEAVEHVTGLHLERETQAEVLLDVGLEVPPFIVRHRNHHLEHAPRSAEREQLGNLGLGEAAELDVAQTAHGWNNGSSTTGLLEIRMEVNMSRSPNRRRLWRWLIPAAGGLLSAVLIVIGTPHVASYLRLVLAVIAFLYIGGQSAAYLWSSHTDQG